MWYIATNRPLFPVGAAKHTSYLDEAAIAEHALAKLPAHTGDVLFAVAIDTTTQSWAAGRRAL